MHLYRSYLLAMSDRKSRNIWMEMLQQQNPHLEPPVSETDGHLKSIPSYINMIRTLPTPSPILRTKSHPQERVHISELENYHYSLYNKPRRRTWTASGRSSTSGLLTSSRESHTSLADSVSHSVSNTSRASSDHSLNTASDHEHRE